MKERGRIYLSESIPQLPLELNIYTTKTHLSLVPCHEIF